MLTMPLAANTAVDLVLRLVLWPVPMRVLGILLLFLIGLGFGLLPEPAQASPCPFHTQAHHLTGQTPATQEPVMGPGDPGTITVAVAFDLLGLPPLNSGDGHAVPEGHSCCHAATASVPPHAPALEPSWKAIRKVGRSWLDDWVAPTNDIYRPPAAA